jgi:hypothetical protein
MAVPLPRGLSRGRVANGCGSSRGPSPSHRLISCDAVRRVRCGRRMYTRLVGMLPRRAATANRSDRFQIQPQPFDCATNEGRWSVGLVEKQANGRANASSHAR